MPKPDFEKEIQKFVEAEVAEQARRAKVMKRLVRMHQRLIAKVKAGETTGDIARDFIICCGHGFSERQREIVLKKLREVQTGVASHAGQAALIVRHTTATNSSFSTMFRPNRRSYMMGYLAGDRIVLDINNASWKLPTTRYVSLGDSGHVSDREGLMSANMVDMYSWYGIGNHARDTHIEFVFGFTAIDEHFAKGRALRDLQMLAHALNIDMGAFPKNALRLAEQK